MRVVEAGYEIMHMDTSERIEAAGRVCYKSESKIGCTIPPEEFSPDLCVDNPTGNKSDCHKCTFHSSTKFIKTLVRNGHHAMLEHGGATVKFITNRGVSHELVRHRLCSFGQESTRYVNYGGKDMEFIRPVWCPEWNTEDKALGLWLVDMKQAEENYNELIGAGWKPEQAREVLPNSLKTEIVVTANYREWVHIFNLRVIGTTGRPHPQMRSLMLPLLVEFGMRMPSIFSHQVEEAHSKNLLT